MTGTQPSSREIAELKEFAPAGCDNLHALSQRGPLLLVFLRHAG